MTWKHKKREPAYFLVAGLLVVGLCCSPGWAFPSSAQFKSTGQRLNLAINFKSGNLTRWLLPHPGDWEILSDNGLHYLHMRGARHAGVPRRPVNFALLKNVRVGSFQLQARVRRLGKSVIVVFDYEDTLHFYYAHLSVNRGTEVPVHNGIFKVNGGPRYRIAGTHAKPALPTPGWHTVRIVRSLPSGSIKVYVDGQSQPLFSVVDRTFTCGEIGLGSFDETGDFTDVRLQSNDAGCRVPSHK